MSNLIDFLQLIIVGMTVIALFLLYIIFIVYKPRGGYEEYVKNETAKESEKETEMD